MCGAGPHVGLCLLLGKLGSTGWSVHAPLARVLWLCQRDSGTLNKGTKPLVISINSIIVITSAKPCSIPQAEGASPFSKLPHLTQYSNKAELILHCNYLCNIYPTIRLPAPGYQQGGSESCLSPRGKEKGNRGCSASTDEQVSEGELLSRTHRGCPLKSRKGHPLRT